MPAGALVSYPAPAAADSCGIKSVVCAAPSGSTFPIGTNTVGCTVADHASHSAACSFTVKVKSPAEQIADLIVTIDGLPGVPNGTRNSLEAKLEAALRSIGKDNTTPACNELSAMLNEVQAQAGKGITAEQAADLLAVVTRIRAALGCA